MYASVKEGEKRVSVIAHTKRREKTLACPDEKICAGKERILRALWKRYIAYKTRALLKRTLMIKLNSWLISAWNANVSVSSSPAMMIVVIVCVSCALCNGVKISPQERAKVKRQSFRV